MIHEGLSVGEDCVSSITFQYPIPAPVVYWRSFFPRVRRTKDMRGCFRSIRTWATLGKADTFEPLPFGEAEKYAEALAKSLDRDQDGQLSIKEFGQSSEDGKNAFRYHDVDGDGLVMLAEFIQNFAAWSAVEHQ